jgi:hypothetical protein
VTNAVVFGPAFMERIANDVEAHRTGLRGLAVVLAGARGARTGLSRGR